MTLNLLVLCEFEYICRETRTRVFSIKTKYRVARTGSTRGETVL